MRAAVVERYGPPDVVHVEDVPDPEPRADEIVVRVHAAAVTAADARARGANFPPGFGLLGRLAFGLRRPRRQVLGTCFSGQVVAAGTKVRDVAVGDEVCGMTGMKMGAHAEQLAVRAKRVVAKPPEVDHEAAAALLFGGTTALCYLRDKGKLESGGNVLVNGASGAVGTSAVQLARHYGATVTAVTSGANIPLVTELGADEVIDYTREELADHTGRFDVVLDAVGNISPESGRRLLTPSGVLLLAVSSLGEAIRARGNVKAGPAAERPEDFTYLLQLAAEGVLDPVLSKVYALDDLPAAHTVVDSSHKVGNLVVSID